MALIKDYKITYSLETMCEVINEPDLCEFVIEVQKLGYKTKPNYDKLRAILQGLVMNEKQQEFHRYYKSMQLNNE